MLITYEGKKDIPSVVHWTDATFLPLKERRKKIVIFRRKGALVLCVRKRNTTRSRPHCLPSTPFDMIFALHCKLSSRVNTHNSRTPGKPPPFRPSVVAIILVFVTNWCATPAGMLNMDTGQHRHTLISKSLALREKGVSMVAHETPLSNQMRHEMRYAEWQTECEKIDVSMRHH